jgi:hypothetical protein
MQGFGRKRGKGGISKIMRDMGGAMGGDMTAGFAGAGGMGMNNSSGSGLSTKVMEQV